MKKYIVFIAVSSLLFCSSCTSFLEETNPNKIPASTFYQTEDDIAMAREWCVCSFERKRVL